MEKSEKKQNGCSAKKTIGVVLFIIYNAAIISGLIYGQLRQDKLELRINGRTCDCASKTPPVEEETTKKPIIVEEQQLRDIIHDIISPLKEVDFIPFERSKREVISKDKFDISSLLRGRDGRDGSQGPPGPQGIQGPVGPAGKDGRDASNLNFVNHIINTTVTRMVSAEMNKVRLQAKEIPTVAGATYVRWGRINCSSSSSLLYQGRAGGQRYDYTGGASQFLCMPEDPEYNSTFGTSYNNYIFGVEYESTSNFKTLSSSNQNVPCVLCQANGRASKIMLPAKMRCPDHTWTKEYTGILMSEYQGSKGRTEYMCVDGDPEAVPGMTVNEQGVLLYSTAVMCSGGSGTGNFGLCPPYKAAPVTCTVCTK